MNYLRYLQNSRMMNESAEGEDAGGATSEAGKQETPETFTPEQVQEMISKKVAEAQAEIKKKWEEDVKGLKDNRDALKDEKVAAQQKLKDIELRQKLVDADEKDLEKIRQEIRDNLKNQYDEQLNSTKAELDNLKKTLDNKTIHSALDAKLNDLKVKSTLRNALKAEILFENKPAIVDDKVVIGDTPIDDFFSEWQKSERSKDFIVAVPSSGGGSAGSGASGHSHEVDLTQLSGKHLFAEAFKQKAASKK